MINVIQSLPSGFTAPAAAVSMLVLPSAYDEVDNFSVTIQFQGQYPAVPSGFTYRDALAVTSTFDWAAYSLTLTNVNASTVKLTGPSDLVFPDQTYRFKLPDYSEPLLLPTYSEPYFGLIQYTMPAAVTKVLSYPFNVTIYAAATGSTTEVDSITLQQEFYWNYPAAAARVLRLVAAGMK